MKPRGEKGTKLYYYIEGKTINGKNGVQNAIEKGEHQAGMIVIDVQRHERAARIADIVKNAFVEHKNLREIWLYKGSIRITINKQWAESRNFEADFRYQWGHNK